MLWLAFLASIAVVAGLVALLRWDQPPPSPDAVGPLLVYCAAGLKTPVEVIAREYEQAYGIPVRAQYGGSQTLLAGIELNPQGDLYVPADDSYLTLARDKGLIEETVPLTRMTPVLGVARGNPKGLRSLADLRRDGVRMSQANPDVAAIGKVVRTVLKARWDALQPNVVVSRLTVTDAASDVKLGTADAAFVWDANVRQMPDLEAVTLPELAGASSLVSASVLTASERPAAALHFARYLAARDRGLPYFARDGYAVVEGDPWVESPELMLYSGAMLRPAIEETIATFERREGVRVTRVYNGCGILVAQMRTDRRSPDLYFACDASFMEQVRDLFADPLPVSSNRLVILVPKGNPHGIRALRDLGQPGLRVGIGHEKQCALGVITQETLNQTKTLDPVMKNVVAQFPTGDMLVNELKTGALDAVVAYVSNAAGSGDVLEAIAVDVPCAVAVQPVAVGKHATYPQLARRLVAAIRSRESRARFEEWGFGWRAEGAP